VVHVGNALEDRAQERITDRRDHTRLTNATLSRRATLDETMATPLIEIPSQYRGWWRITETSQWVNDGLDILGTALISITGHGDRLRLHCLLAYVTWKVNAASLSFTWNGSWEFDEMTGTGNVKLRRDGRLDGRLAIKSGDKSTFIAESAEPPERAIPHPPSWRDKWGSRR
jgi:hypothetical protein